MHWTPPADNGTAEITQYRVLVYSASSNQVAHANVSAKNQSHQVSLLKPDTNYTVEVKAGNAGGVGNGTSANFTTKQKGYS